MALTTLLRRSTFRTYILVLCVLYFLMVLLFHSDLQQSQPEFNRPASSAAAASASSKHPTVGRSSKFDELPAPLPTSADERRRRVVHRPSNVSGRCSGSDDGAEYTFLEVVNRTVYAFSAYWDRRPNDFDNKDNASYIRVMAVVHMYKSRPQLECRVQAESGDVLTSKATYYEMCENHGMVYGGFILSCPLPANVQVRPCSVELSPVNRNRTLTTATKLKVLSIDPQENQHKFAVCIPPLFGQLSPTKLVEFIEMSRILGAEHLTFYDYDVSHDIAKVLEYYQHRQVVSVVPWRYPERLDNSSWYHGQLVSIQDCLYRNMRSAEFLSFNDVDEFIVPHRHADWGEMIQATFQPQTQCAFQFHSVFYERGSVPDNNSSLRLFTMRSTRRTTHSSQIRTKCMVKPYRIFEKGIHHVSKPIWADLQVTRMSEKVAFLHHYRKCMMDFGMNCRGHDDDLYMLKFHDNLNSRVSNVIVDNDLQKYLASEHTSDNKPKPQGIRRFR